MKIDSRHWTGSIPVGGRADVDFPGDTAGLELVSQGDVISKKAVTGHLNSDYSGKNRPRMQSNAHLKARAMQRSGHGWTLLLASAGCVPVQTTGLLALPTSPPSSKPAAHPLSSPPPQPRLFTLLTEHPLSQLSSASESKPPTNGPQSPWWPKCPWTVDVNLLCPSVRETWLPAPRSCFPTRSEGAKKPVLRMQRAGF